MFDLHARTILRLQKVDFLFPLVFPLILSAFSFLCRMNYWRSEKFNEHNLKIDYKN